MKRPLLVAVLATTALAVPASAIAATVGEDANGVVSFRAEPGEANAVYSSGGFPPLFRDLGAPVTVQDPCTDEGGGAFSCFFAPELFLNDRADIGWIVTNFGGLTMHGGGGADDLFASASQDARAEGDSGNDIVDVTSGLTGYGVGGSGDDQITGGGPTDGASVLDGGGDDDLLAHSGSSLATLDGGSGSDRIVAGNVFGASSMSGDGGSDVLTFATGAAPQGAWTIDGGGGDDVVTGHPALDVVHGGGGNDRIDVADGGADTVDCGTGIDIVWADAADTVARDCELRFNFRGPRNAAVESARAAAATLIARPHPFPDA